MRITHAAIRVGKLPPLAETVTVGLVHVEGQIWEEVDTPEDYSSLLQRLDQRGRLRRQCTGGEGRPVPRNRRREYQEYLGKCLPWLCPSSPR